ncbi:hypothetical protein PF005_g7509 [Phytophthora fragariae]|uniref:Uncharacterized protein n=1 Tax=Phytophthora fragariae TaxID=53985 RepID=A0A6A3UAB5_9STRA|nr:hypothetical protein PF003_g19688 [Phytophthora fragariae]KAE9121663.1 hypothetical protein PF007_g7751 [Phytophthora fragariae]KAE9148442.1 hypothetical protein PF006_g6963 [Phytophthora fragariae]KAE9220357.1 hypothetical protein PF005_g7509 [Phytophthora fragariae]KAE9320665.1 hypothetical protein PF001_g5293 [Phytophthora fragariae]
MRQPSRAQSQARTGLHEHGPAAPAYVCNALGRSVEVCGKLGRRYPGKECLPHAPPTPAAAAFSTQMAVGETVSQRGGAPCGK